MSNPKKMGRPPVADPRIHRVEIKFSKREIEQLDALCTAYQKDRSSVIRFALSEMYKKTSAK